MRHYELYEKYKRSLYFFFNKVESKISGFDFYKGVQLDYDGILYYNVEKLDSYLSQYDYLPVSSGPPLVSRRFRDTFSDIENNQLQYYQTEIKDKHGNICNDFFAINILNIVECLDKKKSIFEINEYGSYDIQKIYFDSSLIDSKLLIVRLKEDELRIIVNETFVTKSKDNLLKGMGFEEEGYSIYTDI